MLKISKKDGFASFLEVVISAIIFVVAGFGIFVAISSLSPHSQKANLKLKAMYLGKNIAEELYQQVGASSWNCEINTDGDLCPGQTTTYYGNYRVMKKVGEQPSGARKVELRISFPDE